MEEEQRNDHHIKKNLATLHKRIQYKYIEMQKKLEKSKSVDSMSSLSDDFSILDYSYGSLDDLRETDEVFIEGNKNIKSQSFIMDVHKQNAVSRDVEFVEACFAEIQDNKNAELEKYPESNDNLTQINVSTESINEVGKDIDDGSLHTPPPKSIRQRFFAARERRREEKERQAQIKKEKMEKLILSNIKQDNLRINRKNKLATVTVALIEATGLGSVNDGKERLLFCRYRLGPEKGKSRVVKSTTSTATWQELFNIHVFDNSMLELSCFDKQTFLGRNNIDLSLLEKEKTHKLRLDLHDGEASGAKLFILLTITGISLFHPEVEPDDLEKVQNSSVLPNVTQGVGFLSVIVYGAKGLSAQDCYCVLKLGNERLQTYTEYKTHEPNWMKIFTFNVTDITSILEIAIVEEKKNEEVGKISIPLLKIHNGEKVWYALKDSTLRERAKGHNPRILLEMRTSWKILKASIRVINPKEEDLLQVSRRLDRQVFARNLTRSKAVINWTLDTLKLTKTCFEWESRKWNTIALIIWIIFCYFFKLWMLPLLLLTPFIKYRPDNYFLLNSTRRFFKGIPNETAIAKVEKEEKSSLRQKIHSLTEMIQSVQNGIGKLASIGESIKNLFNFTVPFVSLLAAFFILVIAFVMYMIPLKYILIGWGIHKFTRKILRPNRIPNSEILDLLSRVPDDETLHDCEELPLELEAEEEEIKRS